MSYFPHYIIVCTYISGENRKEVYDCAFRSLQLKINEKMELGYKLYGNRTYNLSNIEGEWVCNVEQEMTLDN